MRDVQRESDMLFEEFMHFEPFRHRIRSQTGRSGWLLWLLASQQHGFGASTPSEQVYQVGRYAEQEERLLVRRVSYASPGSFDVAGLGACLGQVKDLVLRLLDRKDGKMMRRLKEEHQHLDNDLFRVKILRDFVALAKEVGCSEPEIRQMIADSDGKLEALFQVVDKKKLTRVSDPNEKGDVDQ